MSALRAGWWLCAGPVLWLHAFAWLYGWLSVSCAAGGPGVGLALVWSGHLLLGCGLQWQSWRRARALPADAAEAERFLARAAVALASVGWGGVLFIGWPLLWLDPCL